MRVVTAAVIARLCLGSLAENYGGACTEDPCEERGNSLLQMVTAHTRTKVAEDTVLDVSVPAGSGALGKEHDHNASLLQGHQQDKAFSHTLQEQAPKKTVQSKSHTLQEQAPKKTVQSKSFFQRLKESFVKFVIGITLIIFSFPVLWLNESRNAKMQSLLARGESDCRTASGKRLDTDNRNTLVYINGEQMRSAVRIEDPQFGVGFDDNCVRLETEVEVFQYVEAEDEEERERFGGGTETVKTYTYTTEWSSVWHDSTDYHDRSKVNYTPNSLLLGTETRNCSRVEYGGAFVLTEELVSQCDGFQDASARLPDFVKCDDSHKFCKSKDGAFYYRIDGQLQREAPKVGDARVAFRYVPDGPATVVALQVDQKEDTERDTFLPYRVIRRGLCGLSPEEEKRLLRRRAEQSRESLARDDQCGTGCLWHLCCACNLVSMCYSRAFNPEIHHLFAGSLSFDESFQELKNQTAGVACMLRVVGWAMMCVGFYLLFSPFLTFIKIIPFLGPILSKLGGFIIGFCSLILTVCLSSVVIMVAYLFYHPLKGLLYGLLAAATIVVPIAVVKAC